MSLPRLGIALLSVCLLLTSCGGRADHIILQAEQILTEQPDSALRLLQTVNRRSLSDERLARYALFFTIAQDKSGTEVRSDSLLRYACRYYDRHPEDSLYARCQYYKGLFYMTTDSTKLCEECFRTAVKYAEERGEYYTLYLALNRLSNAIKYADAPRALQYSKQAYKVYSEHCSLAPTNAILLMLEIGEVSLLCHEKDSALHTMSLALEEARQMGDSSMISSVMQDLSLVYREKKDYQKALSLAKAAWEMSPAKSLNLVSCLANSYADADSIRQARELYATITAIGSHGQKYLAYQHLAGFSLEEHDIAMARTYSDSAVTSMEAIYKQSLEEKAAYYHDVIQLEEDNLRQEKELLRKTFLILCCLLLLAAMVMTGAYLFIYIRNRDRRKLEIERERHQLREKFERKQHESELAHKNAQLSMMRNLIMEKYNFRKKIEEDTNAKHIVLTQEDWTEISAFLEATGDNFPSRFRMAYPNLREKDYQFCMLVRLGFSNKYLANIYCIAEVSIKQKMVDYKKKLDIPDKSISFKQFITNF